MTRLFADANYSQRQTVSGENRNLGTSGQLPIRTLNDFRHSSPIDKRFIEYFTIRQAKFSFQRPKIGGLTRSDHIKNTKAQKSHLQRKKLTKIGKQKSHSERVLQG